MRFKKLSIWFVAVLLWVVMSKTMTVPPLFLPTPWSVVQSTYDMIFRHYFLMDILITFYRLTIGFLLGVAIGVFIGVILGYSQRMQRMFEGVIDFIRTIPVTALFPLFLLVFGIGDLSKFIMVAWASALIIMISTMYGVRDCSQTRILLLKSLGASPYQIFKFVILPESLPRIFTGLRICLSQALVVVIIAEMFMGTRDGLGQVIYNTSLMYRISEMYAAIITTGLIGYLINILFGIFHRRIIFWLES